MSEREWIEQWAADMIVQQAARLTLKRMDEEDAAKQ